MKSRFHSLRALAVLLAVVAPSAKAQSQFYTFFPNDATVNYAVYTPANVVGYAEGEVGNYLSPSSPTVNFVTGCSIGGGMDVYNHSIVNINADVESLIFAHDNSTVNVMHGVVYAMAGVSSSTINFYGGSISDLEAWDNNQVYLSGGHVDYLGASFSGIVNMTGGDFDMFVIGDNATANIFGNNLFASLLDPDFFGSSIYALSGTLSDGSTLGGKSFSISNGTGASFHLFNATAVPEPSSPAMLVGTSMAGAAFLRRRKHA